MPTRRILVEVVTTTGERLDGVFYAPESPYNPTERDDVQQVLNDDRLFLPFGGTEQDERRRLMSKDHIVRVRLTASTFPPAMGIDLPQREEFRPDPVGESCTVVLSDGVRITGRPIVDTPWTSSRLLDKLNHADRFIPLLTDDGIAFLHRDHLVSVE